MKKSNFIAIACLLSLVFNVHTKKSNLQTNTPSTCTEVSCPGITKAPDGCYDMVGCRSYQVSLDHNRYGCGRCNKGSTLFVDSFGAGVCKPSTPETSIENCKESYIETTGDLLCRVCEKSWVLSSDAKSCSPITENGEIENCVFYKYDESSTNVRCMTCEPGHSVTTAGDKCLNKCSVPNCQNCAQFSEGGVELDLCFQCLPDTIGVKHVASGMYSECYTCRTWKCKILTGAAQQKCLAQS